MNRIVAAATVLGGGAEFYLTGSFPTISFCGAVPWWIWCRTPNKVQNPLKPVKKGVKKVLKP